jgi:hypothetical protein
MADNEPAKDARELELAKLQDSQDWSLYRDHEKRKIAFDAGCDAARLTRAPSPQCKECEYKQRAERAEIAQVENTERAPSPSGEGLRRWHHADEGDCCTGMRLEDDGEMVLYADIVALLSSPSSGTMDFVKNDLLDILDSSDPKWIHFLARRSVDRIENESTESPSGAGEDK